MTNILAAARDLAMSYLSNEMEGGTYVQIFELEGREVMVTVKPLEPIKNVCITREGVWNMVADRIGTVRQLNTN